MIDFQMEERRRGEGGEGGRGREMDGQKGERFPHPTKIDGTSSFRGIRGRFAFD